MTNEQMQAIYNLDVTKKFVHELFKFVASFSILEEKLQAELAEKNQSACLKTAMEICTGLKKIYAGDLADEFYRTAQLLRNKEHEEIEMYLADFLVYVAMLSADIQLALFKHDIGKTGVEAEKIKTGPAAALPEEKNLVVAVDDTMMFLITLKSYLKDMGYNLEEYTSLDETVGFLTKRRPRLIFLGVDMPKMGISGFKLTSKIRELGHDAPIVYFTSNASEKNVIKAMEMGAAGFIVKPASQKIVLNIIEKLIGLPEVQPKPVKAKKAPDFPEMPDFPELQDLPQE